MLSTLFAPLSAPPPRLPSLDPLAIHPYGFPPETAVPHDECGVTLALPCENSVEVFALGADRAMYHRRRSSGSWSEWKAITQAGNVLGGPAVTTDGAGRLHVLARGPDQKLWHTQQTPPNGSVVLMEAADQETQESLIWSQWRHAGNISAITSPTLTVGADGRVHAFALGESKGVWHAQVPLCCNEAWGWEALGGIWASKPAVVSDSTGAIHVFTVGTDDAMWTTRQLLPDPSAAAKAKAALALGDVKGFEAQQSLMLSLKPTWSPWTSLGGMFASEPKVSAMRQEGGTLMVVARAHDRAFHAATRGASGSWSSWAPLPGMWSSGPALLPLGQSGAELFGRSMDLAVSHATLAGDGAQGDVESLGGRFSTTPAVMEDADGLLEVYARGFDGEIWSRKQMSGGGWAAWLSLGGDFLPFPC